MAVKPYVVKIGVGFLTCPIVLIPVGFLFLIPVGFLLKYCTQSGWRFGRVANREATSVVMTPIVFFFLPVTSFVFMY